MTSPVKPLFLVVAAFAALLSPAQAKERPHIILVMADDLGWGQTGYAGHPQLKTPHLDAMASNGLRFDRFYAGASTCSPTRATVLTGRSNDRTGVTNHGIPLRLQEKTVAQALQKAGYMTAHFGKWHLNGLRGPGVPVLASDTHHPGAFGFNHWLSVTNFFDRNPILSRLGEFEEHEGDSSEVIVAEALHFLAEKAPAGPTFTLIWYGTPHDPHIASDEDRTAFASLPENYQHQYGEITAMDRSIGALRAGLKEMGIARDTLVWFCSDNGGLAKFGPETMGGLRGSKGTFYEGGLRVPAILEWPARIPEGRVTAIPAGTVDIFPTLSEIIGLEESDRLLPQDGISLVPLIAGTMKHREKPLPFRQTGKGALIGEQYKFLILKNTPELYDLVNDPAEEKNLAETLPEVTASMQREYEAWNAGVEASVAGKDYPEGSVSDQPESRLWQDDPSYAPYLQAFSKRPEYRAVLKKTAKE
jgi:arylsulfatase A-like enzyme